MDKLEWLTYAKENGPKLAVLIEKYHPVNLANLMKEQPLGPGKITAKNAESACAKIRVEIAEEEANLDNPVVRLQNALNNNDAKEIYKLLSDAWIGVPESRECWQITGFKEAVVLLEEDISEELFI